MLRVPDLGWGCRVSDVEGFRDWGVFLLPARA